jgi:hypothetical protein
MAVSQKTLAERWELSPGRISQLVSEGMPLDSIEEAEKWRAQRHLTTGIAPGDYKLEPGSQAPGEGEDAQEAEDKAPPTVLETFDSIVERQRILVQISRNQYIKAVKSGSPQQSRLYASYDKTVNTLTKLKAEADRLALMNREYIRASDAKEAMRVLASEFVNRLDKLALDVAEACNPENPAKAVKALEAWSLRVRTELSKDGQS